MDHSFDKAVWLEGMFLSPQHFQQQERYLERYNRQLFNLYAPGKAGFTSLGIDNEQLKVGKLFIREASGLFPDGTPFELPASLSMDLDSSHRAGVVYIAVPLDKTGCVNTAPEEKITRAIRYVSAAHSVYDGTDQKNEPVQLELSRLNPGLMAEGEALDDYSTLAVAHIQEYHPDGEVVLDNTFIPRCLDYRVSRYLLEQVQNLRAMVKQRASVIATQIGVEGQQKSYQTLQIEYLWLQALNRHGAWLKLVERQSGISAYELYRMLAIMAADLATFTTTLAPEFPDFNEQDIYASFAPVLSSLLLNLRQASKDKVVKLGWDTQLFKLRRLLRTRIDDRTLFNDGRFILSVSSSLSQSQTRTVFINAAKLCGHNRIAERVRNALTAVPISAMAGAPIELRAKANTVYFEIDTDNELWQEMVRTHDLLALHVDEQMPDDTAINCFVIR